MILDLDTGWVSGQSFVLTQEADYFLLSPSASKAEIASKGFSLVRIPATLDAVHKSLPQQALQPVDSQTPAHILLTAPRLFAAALPAKGRARLAHTSSEGLANLRSQGDT